MLPVYKCAFSTFTITSTAIPSNFQLQCPSYSPGEVCSDPPELVVLIMTTRPVPSSSSQYSSDCEVTCDNTWSKDSTPVTAGLAETAQLASVPQGVITVIPWMVAVRLSIVTSAVKHSGSDCAMCCHTTRLPSGKSMW